MKHMTITEGHEWQDQESGERQDDFREVCIICGTPDVKESDECPDKQEDENDME